jgi:hypothetical protein
VNPVLVVERAPDAACSVYGVPVLFNRRFANVATPPTAATVGVLLAVSAPPTGPVAMLMVTFPENVAVLPMASRAVTLTDGPIGIPAVELAGWVVNTSCVAMPPVMLKLVLVNAAPPATPADVAWSV